MSALSYSRNVDDEVQKDFPIDFVILWVDGNDPQHERKRLENLADFKLDSLVNAEQSTDLKRFVQHNELVFCLRSIKQHAPWYRKIHLVTDNQIPQFLDKDRLHLDRIEIVDHKELFRGKEDYLPTFNSRCLTSMISGIQGLSEHFIYGNDDMMLGSAVTKNFFFEHGKAIVYAEWGRVEKNAPVTLHQQGIINAAQMQGFDKTKFLVISHGFQPLLKSSMLHLAKSHPKAFINNISYKFRHESQFLPEALFNHYAIKSGKGRLKNTELMVHFSFELCREGTAEKIKFLFKLIEQGKRKMFCLNEFQSLYAKHPQVTDYLTQICGPALLSEVEYEKGEMFV